MLAKVPKVPKSEHLFFSLGQITSSKTRTNIRSLLRRLPRLASS